WARCRKIVTLAMVMWVVTSVYRTICHQDRFQRPLASQSIAAFRTAQSGSNMWGESLSLVKPKAAELATVRVGGMLGRGVPESVVYLPQGVTPGLFPTPRHRSRPSRAGAARAADRCRPGRKGRPPVRSWRFPAVRAPTGGENRG